MMTQTVEKPLLITLAVDSNDTGSGWKAVLFNCNCHTFETVVDQLMKAIKCSQATASQLANVADQLGNVTVYEGSKARCEAVAGILGSVGLDIQVTE